VTLLRTLRLRVRGLTGAELVEVEGLSSADELAALSLLAAN
jgi:hypothetical protein